MTNGILQHCISIDEWGYNIWTARGHGQATVGERAYREVLGQCGKNVTITLAMSPTAGLVHYTSVVGRMNARVFNDFLAQARRQLNPDDLVYMIYDGASVHRNANINANPAANTVRRMLPALPLFCLAQWKMQSVPSKQQ